MWRCNILFRSSRIDQLEFRRTWKTSHFLCRKSNYTRWQVLLPFPFFWRICVPIPMHVSNLDALDSSNYWLIRSCEHLACPCVVKLAFHNADVLARIVAIMSSCRLACHRNTCNLRKSRVSARMSVSASWNASLSSCTFTCTVYRLQYRTSL